MNPRRAPLTWAIAGLTVLAWLASGLGGPHLGWQAGFVPLRSAATLPLPAVPFALTPLTATLLHGGPLHLLFNMLMLLWCGTQLEERSGPWPIAALYVAGAYAAALAQWLAGPQSGSPMIGASGAIAALLGAYALLFPAPGARPMAPFVRALWLAVAWAGLQWLIGAATGGGETRIATAAHVGGFVAGLALAPWVAARGRRRRAEAKAPAW